MGLDDLIPDDKKSTSRSSSRKSTSSEKQYEVEVGSGSDEVKFTEEKWKGVKRVITEEFGLVPNEVLNKPSSERYEILTDAAKIHEGEKSPDESSKTSKTRCDYCGSACDDANVEVGGKTFCVHHTIAQVETVLK